MPKVAKPLTAVEVSRLREPGFHFVGTVPGLALQVTDGGARSWVLRVMVGTRRRDMGLGAYPAVTLADAHRKAREAREAIRTGTDPVAAQQAARSALRAAALGAVTFRQVAEAYMRAHRASWKSAKHAGQWAATLEQYAYPVLGDMLVRDVEKPHVMAVLEPIWLKRNETASRLRSRLELVLSYAMQAGHRPEGLNPARWRGGLDKLLARPAKVQKVEHHAALPIAEMGAFMARLRKQDGMAALVLQFVILTACRSGEARGATWSEIDLDEALWSLPGERMKAGRPHRVPLSPAAVELLRTVPRFTGVDLVFPAPRGGPLSDMALSALMRRMAVPATPHGARSTFRDWAGERTTFPREVAEAALAHAVGDDTERAYARSDLLERRRQLMVAWAEFLGREERPATVIDLPVRAAAA